MTSSLMQSLIQSTGVLCALLLIGMFLRAKVPLFRKLLVPASVLGGFVGLFLGPQVWGQASLVPIREEWVSTWSLLPGILIVPVFAAIPLGKFKNRKKEKSGSGRREVAKVTMISGIASGAFGFQVILGVGLALLVGKLLPNLNLYNNFGFEMSQGFNGGHGSAGAVGNVLMEAGASHWELAQGVSSTFATVGLLGGLILGVFIINRASRNGETAFLKNSAKLPASTSFGYTKKKEEQGELGRETTMSSAIETLSVHLGLILIVCALAYWIRGLAVTYEVIGFEDIPVWPYALIIMYGVNFLLNVFKLDWLVDARVKSHISGAMSDLAITAAIASMPVKAVMAYMLPIALISAAAFVVVYYTTVKMFQLLMPDSFPFERGILSFGINTGVMMTGITLLKICDPDFESPALEDYSFSYAIRTVIDLISTPIMYAILARGTSYQMLMFGIVYVIICYVIVGIGKMMYRGKDETAKTEEAAGRLAESV